MDFATKYRPKGYSGIVGQPHIISALREYQASSSYPHTILFSGPSGTGKTTLARIIAKKVGATGVDCLEVDGATHTGVDTWREISSTLGYRAIAGASRVIIVDECQMLSKAAWNSLLKVTEEPPPHVYWIFCTTEVSKVPRNIRTRCSEFTLKNVPKGEIADLVGWVVEREGLEIPGVVQDAAVKYAGGSPRQALTGLSVVLGAVTADDAWAALSASEQTGEIIVMCRSLLRGELTWVGAMKILSQLEEANPESLRRIVTAYFSKVAMNPKNSDEVIQQSLAILDAFGGPYPMSTNLGPFLVSLGKLIYAPE